MRSWAVVLIGTSLILVGVAYIYEKHEFRDACKKAGGTIEWIGIGSAKGCVNKDGFYIKP